MFLSLRLIRGLFPIRLGDAVKEAEAKQAWAGDIRRRRHIGDFRGWKDHDKYKKAYRRSDVC
jgi:hypothetical protein